MHIITTNFNGNPNVGLFGYANDEYCLLGRDVPKSAAVQIEKALKVPVHQMSMCGTSMIGAFVTGNSRTLLVPNIAFEEELKELKKIGIRYTVISTKLTALGNNILCNDHGCLVNPEFPAAIKKIIRQALNVKVVPYGIAGTEITGSCGVIANNRCLLHRDASQREISKVEEELKVTVETGTVNMANPYVRSGILCNNNGLIVGDASGGPEVAHIDESLGYLEKELAKKARQD